MKRVMPGPVRGLFVRGLFVRGLFVRSLFVSAFAALTLAVFSLAACGDDAPPPPAPTAATAVPVRGELTITRQEYEATAFGPTRVEEGSSVKTGDGARASLDHDGGAWILLDRSTELVVGLEQVEAKAGRTFYDARRGEIVVRVEGGELRASDATFAVDVSGTPTVYCGSGEITWVAGEASGHLAQGETLTFDGDPEPEAAALWDDWTGGLADPAPWRMPEASYVGVLTCRGFDEIGIARRPVSMRAHEVDVSIRGDMAFTTITQTFFNAESAMLEGQYRMRLPEGALVSDFQVDMGGGFVPSVVSPMNAVDGVISWGAPGAEQRLAYDGPDRIRARITPIGPGASVRIKIQYQHWMAREGNRRTYVYPMVDDGAQPPLIGEFRLSVDTSGNRVSAMRAGMGAQVSGTSVVLRRGDYRPTADFYLDLIEEQSAGASKQAVAYVVDAPATDNPMGQAEGNERFVMFDIPTDALDLPEPEAVPLDLVVVLDVSGATQDEDLELARAVVESVLRQLAPSDRIAMLLGDVTAHAPNGLSGEFLEASAENGEAVLEALATAPLGGATDIGRMLRDASVLAAGKPRGTVLYLGDGLATTGNLDASAIARSLSTVDEAPRIFALALGEGSNVDLLRRISEHADAVTVRTEASRAVMRILADAARPMLRSAQVDFGSTIERVYPRLPRTVALDQPLRFIGRLRGELPPTLSVSGTRDGEVFEAEVPVRVATIDDGGDIRRRWAKARLTELVDEDAGREALIEIGTRFNLLTPWTSFVVGGYGPQPYMPVPTFDLDPTVSAIRAPDAASGWRRRRQPSETVIDTMPESTWRSRVQDELVGAASGDGGLGRAAVLRTMEQGERGPRACYERRLVVRPDLQGRVSVSVTVDGAGEVKDAKVESSSLGAADVTECMVAEVRGMRFPNTGGETVSITYSYGLSPSASIGQRRTCSDASRQALDVRRGLWRERLAANGGVEGAVSVWNGALGQCELTSWSARRALLDQMLGSVGGLAAQVGLYQRLRQEAGVGSYIRRAILRRVRTPQEVEYVRANLGLEANVDWTYFSRVWNGNRDANARLRLVRRWLEVLTDEFDLRLRELALLEELGRIPEARRLAGTLRAHPLADAAVYAAVGEFHLRQDDEAEARRVFSELVETAPYDPWARRRLGDLYRAHGWNDDAYREYGSLARLQPGDPSVLLLLARAAAGAGRIDEALRLEQRLSEQSEPGKFEGVAGVAQLWTLARLARLSLEDEAPADAIAERLRATGLLRSPPAVVALFTWSHPEDAPELFMNVPATPVGVEWENAEVRATTFGMEASLVPEREDDDVLKFEVRREDRDNIRDLEGSFWLITGLGTDAQHFERRDVTLTREARTKAFTLTGSALTEG